MEKQSERGRGVRRLLLDLVLGRSLALFYVRRPTIERSQDSDVTSWFGL